MVETDLNVIVPDKLSAAVAVDFVVGGLRLFAIPERHVNRFPDGAPFHCVGGRCAAGEEFHETAHRESFEEIGCVISLVSAPATLLVRHGHPNATIGVDADPRPFVILQKAQRDDNSFFHHDVNWAIGYHGRTDVIDVSPRREVIALLLLTDTMLQETRTGVVTFEAIDKSMDDSRVILRPGGVLDPSRRAVPTGLALWV